MRSVSSVLTVRTNRSAKQFARERDRLGESGESIAADDEHVLHAAVAQLGAHPSPERRALTGLHPDAQHMLDAFQVPQ